MSAPLWMLTTTYVRPESEVDALLAAHVEHLERHRDAGRFLAWGRLVPRTGGFVLARMADRAEVDEVLAEDPFTSGGVATWTVSQLALTGGDEALVALLRSGADATQPSAHHHTEGLPPGASWDERYSAADQVWSGRPNGALVVETEGLRPGRALDVGCGEGADAIWLAGQGWDVTALEVSRVALDRAESAAQAAGAAVRWVHAPLLEGEFPDAFDLVSAQYPALHRTPGHDAERALLDAVAPGGTLLVVHHAVIGADQSREHGFDPNDYVSPADVLALLDDDWTVEVDERRPREIQGGGGEHHTEDVVLRATRRR